MVVVTILAVIGGLVVVGGILAIIAAFAIELLETRRSKIESEMWERQCSRLRDLADYVKDENEDAAYLLRGLTVYSAETVMQHWQSRKQAVPERLGEPR